jgi:hypothetical protein
MEERRLKAFENRVLWIFGQRRGEVTGEWCKLYSEELDNLYPSSSIIRMIRSRRMRLAGNVAQMGKRIAYRSLAGKLEWKRLLERLERRSVDNIQMDLGETGQGGMHWNDVAHDRDQWRLFEHAFNLRVPSNVGKFSSVCVTSSFSRRAQSPVSTSP